MELGIIQPELNRNIWADDAVHAIDFIYWLLGVPETVTAEIATIHDARVPNDNGIPRSTATGRPHRGGRLLLHLPGAREHHRDRLREGLDHSELWRRAQL